MTAHDSVTGQGAYTRAAGLAAELLDAWSARHAALLARREPARPAELGDEPVNDPAVPVLAGLLAAGGPPAAHGTAARAAGLWARTAGRGRRHPGLYDGGFTGTWFGLRQAAALHPELGPVVERLRGRLPVDRAPAAERYGAVTFPDYDLILGPAGLLLTLAADEACAPREPEPLVRALSALCDDPALPGLRAHHPGSALLGWLDGRVDTGMGHGAAGVAVALAAGVRRLRAAGEGAVPPQALVALAHLAGWLRAEAYEDARSVRTWDGAGPREGAPAPGARARQGWCYGTPGVAWALWETADVLGDAELAGWACEAFSTLAAAFDPDFHLPGDHPGDRLGVCHGAAGVLLVADAFHRHAGVPAAGRLRLRMLSHLAVHEDAIRSLAGERTGVLTGAAGVLAAVLTATGGDRGWLSCLGLR
ncbi:lanthionine synthetase LanC family protein [Streptomyces cacaoi]